MFPVDSFQRKLVKITSRVKEPNVLTIETCAKHIVFTRKLKDAKKVYFVMNTRTMDL